MARKLTVRRPASCKEARQMVHRPAVKKERKIKHEDTFRKEAGNDSDLY